MRYAVRVTREVSPWSVTRRLPDDPPNLMRRVRWAAWALLLMGLAALAAGLYIPAKAVLAQVLLERAWARTLEGATNAKPWPWADITPVAAIHLPRLHERAIVLGGTSGQAMAFGPGHMPNSTAIGSHGTAIIAGHRDTHLAFLAHVKLGDLIEVTTADGRVHTFRASETRIVRWDASGLNAADAGPAGARLALVTCYPFGAVGHGPLRYVVIADIAGAPPRPLAR